MRCVNEAEAIPRPLRGRAEFSVDAAGTQAGAEATSVMICLRVSMIFLDPTWNGRMHSKKD